MSLGACLGLMQEMGMNFEHQGTIDCRQNIEMPGFLILVNPKSSEIHETWHPIMERHQHAVVQILSHLGQVWVYASHKPELLTTRLVVSVGNVPPLGTKRYPLPLIAFNFFFLCQHRYRSVV